MRIKNDERNGHLETIDGLKKLSAQLAQADGRKSALMLTVAHELRNPLSPLLFAASALSHSTDPLALRMVPLIERQVGQLTRIVDDLQAGATEQQNPFRMETQSVCVRDVIADALANTKAALEMKHQRIRLSCASPDPRVDGDRERLTQAVSNIVSNAIKFTPPKGTIEIIERGERKFEVIDIIDNGPGIPTKRRDEIFELFARGDQEPGVIEGFGIGLWLARNFIERHGGTLTAHSSPKGGARFRIKLPVAEQSAHA